MRLGDANWPRDALPKGTDLHGYRLEGFIGRGGFGITYRVVDGIDQVFAIKECFPRQFAVRQGAEVLPADEGDAEPLNDCLLRFTKEAKALRQLSTIGESGDGVVKVMTFFQTNRTAYLVMEYLAGRSLDDLIKNSPHGVDEATLRRILPQLLRAVGSVHDAGLLHRDIKPANILLRDDGRPVLIDFGAARGTFQGRTVTYTQIFSEGFAPIEQFAGAHQGPYSDIYALGATLYRAIGGKTVDSFTRHQAILNDQPDPRIPATEIGAGRYGADLLNIIDAAMIVAPEKRPQSAEALLQMLDAEPEPDEPTVRLPARGSLPGPVASERDANAAEAFSTGRRRADASRAHGTAAEPRTRASAPPAPRRMGPIIAFAVFGVLVALGGWAGVARLLTENEEVHAPKEAVGKVAEQKIAAPATPAEADERAAAAAKVAEEGAAARRASDERAAAAAALEKAAADRAEAASRAAAADAAAETAAKQAAEEKAAEAARIADAEASARAATEAAARKAADDRVAVDRARRAEAEKAATDAAASRTAADKARQTETDKDAAAAAAAKAAERKAAKRATAEAAQALRAQQTAQAPVTRAAYFAIARAPEKNYLAYSAMNQPTQESADQQALQKCASANGGGCGVYVRGYDQCVAFAFGSSFFTTVHSAWKQDADLSVATSSALKSCQELHSSACEIIASFCSKGE
jgi:serine/threonine protein kinase